MCNHIYACTLELSTLVTDAPKMLIFFCDVELGPFLKCTIMCIALESSYRFTVSIFIHHSCLHRNRMSHYTYSVAALLNYYEEAVIVSVGGIKV